RARDRDPLPFPRRRATRAAHEQRQQRALRAQRRERVELAALRVEPRLEALAHALRRLVRDLDALHVDRAVLEQRVVVDEAQRILTREAQQSRFVLVVPGGVAEAQRGVPAARAALVRLDVQELEARGAARRGGREERRRPGEAPAP